jgi:hypothetical protein
MNENCFLNKEDDEGRAKKLTWTLGKHYGFSEMVKWLNSLNRLFTHF